MQGKSRLLILVVAVSLLITGLVLLPGAGQALKGRVAVILDVGGRGDLSFNDMGFKGTDEAAADFGLQMDEIQSASDADYLPNTRNAAISGQYDLIIGVGFLLTDAFNTVAAEFPNQKFAIIDSVVDQPNVMSIVFAENEGSALVGALSAMVAAYYGYPKVGVVLGIEIPVLYHFEAGYRFGIDWGNKKYQQVTGTNPNIGLLWTYTGTFSDIAKGYAASQAMLAQGAGLIYNVAGPLGIGDLQAVTEAVFAQRREAGPPFMIGVDANQDYLGDGHRVLASMMKRVDRGCYKAVADVVHGTFQGEIVSLGVSNRGIAISRYQDLLDFIEFGINAGAITAADKDRIISNWLTMRQGIPYWIWDAVSDLEMKIVSGEIVVPTANTVDEMLAIRAQYPLP
ncbi:MAG: BMP family ABC transporter substrate-binding protein [Candidatus Acetothermia bacterium]|jgi:basic membrane protein A|nr:BMP family ABC transporter substrate-binding protein [Candidatus Acetothermia bacterium]MDH7504654.1 BMP family ABC transporter substrate-binding protein [Candidatus Acetothermia bacterium]